MKIEHMRATFGTLQGAELDLSDGLNIIQAPNESGKSTWCAFLLAMLYGVDTSERKTRTNLPAKEHYAPWSGSAMEGKLCVVMRAAASPSSAPAPPGRPWAYSGPSIPIPARASRR